MRTESADRDVNRTNDVVQRALIARVALTRFSQNDTCVRIQEPVVLRANPRFLKPIHAPTIHPHLSHLSHQYSVHVERQRLRPPCLWRRRLWRLNRRHTRGRLLYSANRTVSIG